MSIIYMPSERCPTCPFNTLCEDEITCTFFKESPVDVEDIKKGIILSTRSTIKPTKVKQAR